MNKVPNRRQHKRYNVSPQVLKNNHFELIDLSESGAQLSAIEEYNAQQKIKLSFVLGSESIELTAEVMWCQRSASLMSTGYKMGVRFIDYSVLQQLSIRKYLENTIAD